ncbi:MAG: hypothetical protein IJ184_03400 [Alphaproteobacteria bacterium]|nr:hypothetical protein [Alphaproteobacteria bacterium]
MYTIRLGDVYEVFGASKLDTRRICNLCLRSVSPVALEYDKTYGFCVNFLGISGEDLMGYLDLNEGRKNVYQYLSNGVVLDEDLRFLKAKLTEMRVARFEYKSVPWLKLSKKLRARKKLSKLANVPIDAQYVFDMTYYYFTRTLGLSKDDARKNIIHCINS